MSPTLNETMAATQLDPAWTSHLESDTFWILGIILVINWISITHQVDWSPFPKTTSENGHPMQDIEAQEPASNEPASQDSPSPTPNSDPERQPEASPDLHSRIVNANYILVPPYNPSPTPNSDPERQPGSQPRPTFSRR
jgi:cytoskeletal protein RodZ